MEKPKRLQALTLPSLSHKKTNTYFLKITGPMFTGKPIVKTDAKGNKTEERPADLLPVINLETGEPAHYLVPTIVKERLTEVKEYVGICIEVTKTGRREGKRYDDYTLFVIECPNAEKQAKK